MSRYRGQIIQMLLSKCNTQQCAEPVISIYMPLAVAHLPSAIHSIISDVKSVAVKIGGKRNASCRFLKHDLVAN